MSKLPLPSRTVFAVVLAWNSADCIERCLQSLTDTAYPLNIIVIDNDSQDNTKEVVEQFQNVHYHNTGKNLGYAGGNNVGIHMALERHAEFIFILNPDAYVAQDCVGMLLKAMEDDSTIGMASPKIYYADSNKIWFAGATLDWKSGSSPHIGQGENDGPTFSKSLVIPRANGCALMVRATVLERVGLLDERYFLYFEETDWSVRATRVGFNILFNADAHCWHAASTSTGGYFTPLYQYYTTRNSLLFMSLYTQHSWSLFFCRHLAMSLQRIYRTLRNRPAKTWRVTKAIMRGYTDFSRGRFGYQKLS